MPFDAAFLEAGPELAPGYEGCRQLARALRRQLPDKFWWDFGDVYAEIDPYDEPYGEVPVFEDYDGMPETFCGSVGCAMGLAAFLWPKQITELEAIDSQLTRHLAMDPGIFHEIFYGHRFSIPSREVTPQMVADEIDKYLIEEGEAPSVAPVD